jgi:hypothetical protein
LKDARLEPNLERQRREGKNEVYFQHTLRSARVRALLLILRHKIQPKIAEQQRLHSGSYELRRTVFGNERRVGGMTETTVARTILLPTRKSANWRCSDCAWSQPFVQRLELIPNVPSKAIEDAFNRHKCAQHRHPKWMKPSL